MTSVTRKHLDLAIKRVDAKRRRIRFVASQEAVDRDNDVILVAGIDTASSRRTPSSSTTTTRGSCSGG